MNIELEKELRINNLASYRHVYKRMDFHTEVFDIREQLKDRLDLTQNLMVTITHGFNGDYAKPELDVEVLFALKENEKVGEPYKYVEEFFVPKCMCAQLKNDFEKVEEAIKVLNEAAAEHAYSIGKTIWVQYTKGEDSYLEIYAERKS